MFSCSDFTDEMLDLLVEVGAMSPDDIPENDPEVQYALASAAVRQLASAAAIPSRDSIAKIVEAIAGKSTQGRTPNLDEAVHEAASAIAAEANNGGLDAQIVFLIRSGHSADEIANAAR